MTYREVRTFKVLVALTHGGKLMGGGCSPKYLNDYMRVFECPGTLRPRWRNGICRHSRCSHVHNGRPCQRRRGTIRTSGYVS